MTTGTSSTHVTFAHAFKIRGMKRAEPPGTFSVEKHPKDTGVFSALGNRGETTWIRICENPGINGILRMVKIDPIGLKAALRLDADKSRKIGLAAPRSTD